MGGRVDRSSRKQQEARVSMLRGKEWPGSKGEDVININTKDILTSTNPLTVRRRRKGNKEGLGEERGRVGD